MTCLLISQWKTTAFSIFQFSTKSTKTLNVHQEPLALMFHHRISRYGPDISCWSYVHPAYSQKPMVSKDFETGIPPYSCPHCLKRQIIFFYWNFHSPEVTTLHIFRFDNFLKDIDRSQVVAWVLSPTGNQSLSFPVFFTCTVTDN